MGTLGLEPLGVVFLLLNEEIYIYNSLLTVLPVSACNYMNLLYYLYGSGTPTFSTFFAKPNNRHKIVDRYRMTERDCHVARSDIVTGCSYFLAYIYFNNLTQLIIVRNII